MSVLRSICCMIIICCIFSTGCGKRHMQIDRETRRIIDTTAAREIVTLRPLMDSLCQTKMDSLVSTMTDSVLTERRNEMRKLLGK